MKWIREKTPPTLPYCGLQCCCMCRRTTIFHIWIGFCPLLIISQIHYQFWLLKYIASLKLFHLHLVDLYLNMTSCLHVHWKTWFSSNLHQLDSTDVFCNHTIWSLNCFWRVHPARIVGFWTLRWKYIVCRDNRDCAECSTAQMVQSQGASSGIYRKIFFFYTCLPSILTHVLYRTYRILFSTPLSSLFQNI